MRYFLRVTGTDVDETFTLGDEVREFGSSTAIDLPVFSAAVAPVQGTFRTESEGVAFVSLASPQGTKLETTDGIHRLKPDPAAEVLLRIGDRLLFGRRGDRLVVEVVTDGREPALSVLSDEVTESEHPTEEVAVRSVDSVPDLDDRLSRDDGSALGALYDMLKRVAANQGLAHLATLAAEQIFRTFTRATHVTLFLPDVGGERELEPTFMHHRRGPDSFEREAHVVSRTVLDRVVADRVAVTIRDVRASFELSESAEMANIRACVLVPMFGAEGLAGVLQVDSRRDPDAFDERALDILAVFAQQLGALIENARLREELERSASSLRLATDHLRTSLEARSRIGSMVGSSPAMREVYQQIELGAREDLPVVIIGETGTGKELVSRAIHDLGDRVDAPFLPVNCGAMPGELLESELFGHAKGAFTGAVRARRGLFREASGGTVFLDEIGELPSGLQVKLLRVLEEGQVRAVGSDRFDTVDVRIIAATNRDLETEVEAGRFRADLFYRLHVLRIDLPPLRERKDDLPELAQHFLTRYCGESGRVIDGLSLSSLSLLLGHDWPGNVRELRNEIQRAAAGTEEGAPLKPEAFSPRLRAASPVDLATLEGEGALRDAVAILEHQLVEQALRKFDYNITRTASYLGLSRPGLREKMQRYGLRKEARSA